MTGLFLSYVPLAPSCVPALLALIALAIHRWITTPRRLRNVGWVLVLALLAASTPLWPLRDVPRQSLIWSWNGPGGSVLSLGLDLGSASDPDAGALSLLLLMMAAFGCWSVCRLPVATEQTTPRAAGLPGLLLVIAGGQLAAQSIAPFGAIAASAIIVAGCMLHELLSANRRSLVREAARALLLLLPVAGLTAAVLLDPTLTATYRWWIAGCAGLLALSLLYGATARAPLISGGMVQALGMLSLAVWLMLWTNRIAPAQALVLGAAPGVGALLFGLGAIHVVAASSLRALFFAQAIAQLGIVSLSLGRIELIPALAHLVVACLVLSLLLGWLAETGASERIAALPPFPLPLRRLALAYALVAASVCGLPLTLGFNLRRSIAAHIDAVYIAPVLLGGSTLLLGGLLQPLAAMIRTAPVQPVAEDGALQEANQVEHLGRGGWSVLLVALFAVLSAPYALLSTLADALIRRQSAWPALGTAEQGSFLSAGVRIGVAILAVGFANRALRRLAKHPPLSGMSPVQRYGWALPLAGLAEVVAPLTPGYWLGLGRVHRLWVVALVAGGLVAVLLLSLWGSVWLP